MRVIARSHGWQLSFTKQLKPIYSPSTDTSEDDSRSATLYETHRKRNPFQSGDQLGPPFPSSPIKLDGIDQPKEAHHRSEEGCVNGTKFARHFE